MIFLVVWLGDTLECCVYMYFSHSSIGCLVDFVLAIQILYQWYMLELSSVKKVREHLWVEA